MADKLGLFPIHFALLPYREISFDKNNTLNKDIKILGNKHISTGILTKMASYPRQNICGNVSIHHEFNDKLKRVTLIEEFSSIRGEYRCEWWRVALHQSQRQSTPLQSGISAQQ